jgi:lipoprotein NlpD
MNMQKLGDWQKVGDWIAHSAMIAIFCTMTGCATRSTPPAPIVNVTAAPSTAAVPVTQPAQVNSLNGQQPSTQSEMSLQQPVLGSINPNNPVPTTQTNQTIQYKSGVANNPNNGSQAALSGGASGWIMPTNGDVVKTFSVPTKGVDFTGSIGQPIYAVADGKVLYSGNGLAGYGNLIIIRHDGGYLSAYSHNKNNLVSEGATVKRGQRIANMGVGKNQEPLLHFEVRKNGKPIDPFLVIK